VLIRGVCLQTGQVRVLVRHAQTPGAVDQRPLEAGHLGTGTAAAAGAGVPEQHLAGAGLSQSHHHACSCVAHLSGARVIHATASDVGGVAEVSDDHIACRGGKSRQEESREDKREE
jgi:hypothetical protein